MFKKWNVTKLQSEKVARGQGGKVTKLRTEIAGQSLSLLTLKLCHLATLQPMKSCHPATSKQGDKVKK